MAKTIDELFQKLKNVGNQLDGIIVQLRLMQEKKLSQKIDDIHDADIQEVRTIKEIIQQLESVA